MTAVATSSAEKIFNVLDTELGFFKRSREQAFSKKGEEDFYNEKREELINFLNNHDHDNVSFWFQGYNVTSASLSIDTTSGIHVHLEGDHHSKEEVDRVSNVNKILKQYNPALEL